MKDRPYKNLLHFPINRVSNGKEQNVLEGDKAVKIAHKPEINRIKESLRHHHSVLVVCDKSLTSHILRALQTQEKPGEQEEFRQQKELRQQEESGQQKELKQQEEFKWIQVTCNKPLENQKGQFQSSVTGQLVYKLAEALKKAFLDEKSIVVIRHLDLMTWTAAGQPRHELNDVIYWLTEFPDVVKLAFWDPVFTVPKIIEDLFPTIVSFQVFNRECIWELCGAEEAKKISLSTDNFTLASQLMIYQYLSGTNVVEVRRILRGLKKFPPCIPHDSLSTKKAFAHIRDSVSPGKMQVVLEGGEIAGYKDLREKLEKEILFPFQLRNNPKSEKGLKQADALIPRGMIFYGPPGTGKTEWAKWLSRELGAKLLIINGPELKSKYVGETEAAIRRIFSQARRTAPSLILIDELDSLTPSRQENQGNHDASMVAQFLTEMDGLHKDVPVLVVGTTNRLEAVDNAFKRPGRFEVQVEVGYPDEKDRKAILYHYKNQFELELDEDSINFIVEKTGGPLDPETEEAKKQYHNAYKSNVITESYYQEAGPMLQQELEDRFGLNQITRFSGDHLRAICRYILRESLYSKEHNREGQDMNDPGFLEKTIDAVRKKIIINKSSNESSAPVTDTSHFILPKERFS